VLNLGDTFLLPTVDNPIQHLWVVITERDPKTHEAVCVNITSTKPYTPKSDKTLELLPGEHPEINLPSVVYYKDASVMYLNHVEAMLVARKQKIVCVQKARCSPKLLDKIQKALPASSASKEIKARCKAAWEKKA
jgi:hypothetical protein